VLIFVAQTSAGQICFRRAWLTLTLVERHFAVPAFTTLTSVALGWIMRTCPALSFTTYA
jgi:hypothetical protein